MDVPLISNTIGDKNKVSENEEKEKNEEGVEKERM